MAQMTKPEELRLFSVKKSGQIERSSALGSLKVRKVSRIFHDVFFVSKIRSFEFSRQNLGILFRVALNINKISRMFSCFILSMCFRLKTIDKSFIKM